MADGYRHQVADGGSVVVNKHQVAGNSQDMSTGINPQRMGLQQMLKAVKSGSVRAVMLQDLFRLSRDTAVLVQILEFFQSHNIMLIVLNREPYMES